LLIERSGIVVSLGTAKLASTYGLAGVSSSVKVSTLSIGEAGSGELASFCFPFSAASLARACSIAARALGSCSLGRLNQSVLHILWLCQPRSFKTCSRRRSRSRAQRAE